MSRIVSAGLALVCVTSVGMTTTSCGLLPGSSRGGASSSTPASAPSGSVAPPADGSPYSLPDDQKPALFDPCTEIPREVFADPIYQGLDAYDDNPQHKPGSLNSCVWHNPDVVLGIGSTWFNSSDVEKGLRVTKKGESTIGGRQAILYVDAPGNSPTNCNVVMFTGRGSVRIGGSLTTNIPSFKKQDLGDACQTFIRLAEPLIQYIPSGDFR